MPERRAASIRLVVVLLSKIKCDWWCCRHILTSVELCVSLPHDWHADIRGLSPLVMREFQLAAWRPVRIRRILLSRLHNTKSTHHHPTAGIPHTPPVCDAMTANPQARDQGLTGDGCRDTFGSLTICPHSYRPNTQTTGTNMGLLLQA